MSNKQLTETIEKALEQATPGPWFIQNRHIESPFVVFRHNEKDGMQIIANDLVDTDAYLIANAPEWLRALLEENVRDKRNAAYLQGIIASVQTELQQTREELTEQQEISHNMHKIANQYKDDKEKIFDDLLEQIRLNKARAELFESLRTELSAKDKVLEWYADKEKYSSKPTDDPVEEWDTPDIVDDFGHKARSILSQYRGDQSER